MTFEPTPKMNDPIDLYNLYCDAVRPRMGSYVETSPSKPTSSGARELKQPPIEKPRVAGGSVIIAVPLCIKHDFVIGEPVRGFQGEMVAQTRICIKCGHAERDQV